MWFRDVDRFSLFKWTIFSNPTFCLFCKRRRKKERISTKVHLRMTSLLEQEMFPVWIVCSLVAWMILIRQHCKVKIMAHINYDRTLSWLKLFLSGMFNTLLSLWSLIAITHSHQSLNVSFHPAHWHFHKHNNRDKIEHWTCWMNALWLIFKHGKQNNTTLFNFLGLE